jgi:hypothetical protein
MRPVETVAARPSPPSPRTAWPPTGASTYPAGGRRTSARPSALPHWCTRTASGTWEPRTRYGPMRPGPLFSAPPTPCYRNKCEMSCENLREVEPCPASEGVCVPGCFCPDGLVRSGDDCVPPTECRDCACDGFGNSRHVTFDKSDVLFNGNCTYVLSRDVLPAAQGLAGKHTYQVGISSRSSAFNIRQILSQWLSLSSL